VASLIKTVLGMQHGQIPASLNYEEPNPEIDFANSPFFVNAALREWKMDEMPRRAGVSSFGIGGTNAHLVVEEAPERGPSGESRPWQLLVLSARTSTALESQTANLVGYLEQHPDVNLADVTYTLQVGRRGFGHRRVLLCRGVQDAIAALETQDPQRVLTRFQETKDRPVAFMLPGLEEGGQQVNAGQGLLEEPSFREQVDACAEIIAPLLDIDLRQVLHPEAKQVKQASKRPKEPAVGRAALFALEYSLASLWLEWGIEPQCLIGDGIGAYVAACLAGVFSLEDGLALVAAEQSLKNDGLNLPAIPLVSAGDGEWLTEDEAMDPGYWNDHVDRARPFSERVKVLLAKPEQILLEVGPGRALHDVVMEHADRAERQATLASFARQQDNQPDAGAMLATLGHLWLAGAGVNWYGVHAHEHRHRLPLPTYPFERRRYWIEPYKEGRQAATPPVQPGEIARMPDVADWTYIPAWKTAPSPKPGEIGEEDGPWLVFADGYGAGLAMAGLLQQQGQDVVIALPGKEFKEGADGTFTLGLERPADFAALLAALGESNRLPRRVVHLWSLSEEKGERSPDERFDRARQEGFDSLLYLAQALAEHPGTDPVQICVVSNHTQRIETADRVHPEKATILGLCKVIPQENGQAACRHVDVALATADAQAVYELARRLLAEAVAGTPGAVVAYRGGQRWIQTFEPVQLDPGEPLRPLRENGVYLVSSGLSDISLALARHLARTTGVQLAVIEDEQFPEREQWDQWLTENDARDNISLKIQSIRALEQAGTDVLVLSADPTDAAQMHDAVAQIRERFGALNGILHAVGDLGHGTFRTIQDTPPAGGIRPFERNMRALFVLEEVLSGQEPDFCLLVSSLASILGGVGQSAYAGANTFLDAFAEGRGAPWLAINWDAWQFEQEEQRIAALTPRLARFAISPADGYEAFERVLSSLTGHRVAISTGDLCARMERWLSSEPLGDQAPPGREIVRHPRPQLLTPYVAPTTDLEKTLVNVWQQALGIENVGTSASTTTFSTWEEIR
jgi:acyl transferase domain-containing protein